jgi:hypothetical protein
MSTMMTSAHLRRVGHAHHLHAVGLGLLDRPARRRETDDDFDAAVLQIEGVRVPCDPYPITATLRRRINSMSASLS